MGITPVVVSHGRPAALFHRPVHRVRRLAGAVLALTLGVLGAASAAEPVPPPVLLAEVAASPAPDFTLPRLDGGSLSRADLPGAVTVVHFFATWCEPCRRELPALGRFAARTRTEDVAVVLVDVAETEVRLNRFFAEVAAPGIVLLDRDRRVTRAFDVSILPTTLVLDSDRAVRLAAAGEVDWDTPATTAAILSLRPPSPINPIHPKE